VFWVSTSQIIVSGILLGGLYALIGVGLTLIFGVSRIVNITHGDFVMLGMYITFWLYTLFHVDPLFSVFICFVALFFFGTGAYYLTIRPTLGGSPIMHMFTTSGLSIAMANMALFLWKADFRSVTTPYSTTSVNLLGVLIGVPKLIAIGVILIVSAGLFLFFKTTYTGRAIRASTQDATAAKLVGVNTDRISVIAFGIGSGFAGVAGAILMLIYNVNPSIGLNFLLVAFIVVVLGGMGNIFGALVAGFIVGVAEVTSGVFLPVALKESVYFIIFILVLVFRPSGLFGLGRGSEELGPSK